jgi:monoamine oxidase
MRACIVGAGFAGLAAADRLTSAGFQVEVIEARSRIGGRVWSETLPNGAVVEKGAEFILEGYDIARMLAEKLGLDIVPTGMAYGDRDPRGGPPVDSAELLQTSLNLAQLAGDDHRRSIGDLLAVAAISPGARAALEARLSISTGHEASQLAAHLAAHTSSTFSRTESARIGGGNSRLADRLAEVLRAPIRTSHVASRMTWDATSVAVAGKGFTIEADVALITVPTTVIDDIVFDPALPASKLHAHRTVDYGHAAKLFVPLAETPPPSAVMSVPDSFWCWTALAGESVQPVVSCFAGSAIALERLKVDAGPARWVDRLRSLRPDLKLIPQEALTSTWDDDPWTRAAYSVELAAHPRDHDGLLQPVGPLYFAGEHTAGEWAGTMEGALRSGVRAAEQVLARAGSRTNSDPA